MNSWTDGHQRSIDKMLNPRSIAVVGATPKGGYGGRLLTAVMKAQDRVRIYPVNPNYDEMAGVRCYHSVSELPEAPDLVCVVVPYHRVLPVLREFHATRFFRRNPAISARLVFHALNARLVFLQTRRLSLGEVA